MRNEQGEEMTAGEEEGERWKADGLGREGNSWEVISFLNPD